MALSHDGYSFESADHDPILPASEHELPIVVGQFFGVNGESHIIGEPVGRELFCAITLDGYNTNTLLQAAINTLSSKAGQLTGTLTETISSNSRTFSQCTFLGFFPSGPPFVDGSGVNGWVQSGFLRWRQRKQN